MSKTNKIVGVILAGGAGTRIGGAKGLQPFGKDTLIDAVALRVKHQVGALALNIAPGDLGSYFSRFSGRFPLIMDTLAPGTGPLAGVVTGLEWAASHPGVEWLATFPCDTPFLPEDLVARLIAGSVAGHPVAAEDGERLHGVCALWPIACGPLLRKGVGSGRMRSMISALKALGGTRCEISDPEAFFNINTATDLRSAEAIAARRARATSRPAAAVPRARPA
jgi:molybdopterin-guanine dinucleotide biosynthesis protein A